jgi:hypothetical protein
MTDWNISKVRPSYQAHSNWGAESWPPLSTFTVRNMRTGDIQEITCRGAGLLEGLIARAKFDPVV